MPTYLHFVRHAQGYHNLSAENEQIRDPDLTPLGKEQCAQLCRSFPYHDQVTHLVASPMRRTLYTCLLSFRPAVARGRQIIALPEVQEVSSQPCDIGSPPEALAAEFDSALVDLSRVQPDWLDKSPSSPWAPEVRKLEDRARRARVWLRELGAQAREGEGEGERDAHIVVVTHGGLLHFLTQDWDGIHPNRGTGWENTEYRSYEFVDPTGRDPDASVKETDASWRRRRGSARGLTEAEQRELRAVVQEHFQRQFDRIREEQEARAGANGAQNGQA